MRSLGAAISVYIRSMYEDQFLGFDERLELSNCSRFQCCRGKVAFKYILLLVIARKSKSHEPRSFGFAFSIEDEAGRLHLWRDYHRLMQVEISTLIG